MSAALDAVIDDLATERRELLAVNPPADDERLNEVLAYFERFNLSVEARVTHAALPESTLIVSDGERCLASTDLGDLHTYLFDPATALDAGEATGAPTPATVAGVQQFLARLDNRVYTVTEERVTPMLGVSRHIERRALAAGDGTVHAGFQRLSRLRDRRHTLDLYRALAELEVDVNLYGSLDGDPPETGGASVYADDDGAVVGDYWFVAVDSDGYSGALVAREDVPEAYTGFWTFRPPLVDDVVDAVESHIRPKLRRLDD